MLEVGTRVLVHAEVLVGHDAGSIVLVADGHQFALPQSLLTVDASIDDAQEPA